MNCRESRARLQDHLDRPMSVVEADLKEHLANCPACRKLHHGADRLIAGLASLTRPASPAGLAPRVVAGVLEDRQRRRRRQRLRYRVIVAMAASILLMALGYYWLPVPHAKQAVVAKNRPRHEIAKPLSETLNEAQSAVVSLSERLADQTLDNANLLLPPAAVHFTSVSKEPMLRFDTGQSVRKATMRVAEQMEPLGQSARQALDYFLRELPLAQRRMMN